MIFIAKCVLAFKPQTDLTSDRYHKLFLSGIVASPIPVSQWKTFSTSAIQVGYIVLELVFYSIYIRKCETANKAIFQLHKCFLLFLVKQIFVTSNKTKLKDGTPVKNL